MGGATAAWVLPLIQGPALGTQTIASVSSQHWVPEHRKPLAGVPVDPKAPGKGFQVRFP